MRNIARKPKRAREKHRYVLFFETSKNGTLIFFSMFSPESRLRQFRYFTQGEKVRAVVHTLEKERIKV